MEERLPPRQMGSIVMSRGPVSEPISELIETKRVATSANQSKEDWGRDPSQIGHEPLVFMYPVSLKRKVCFEINTRKGI